MNDDAVYVSPFINKDKYPGPALKPRNELSSEPCEWTVILTTQDNRAFQRVGDEWHGQQSGYYGYDWPEVMHYHGEHFIVLWEPSSAIHKERPHLLGPHLEHHPDNPDATRIKRDGRWVKP